jgi:uncharacterized protein DUF3738
MRNHFSVRPGAPGWGIGLLETPLRVSSRTAWSRLLTRCPARELTGLQPRAMKGLLSVAFSAAALTRRGATAPSGVDPDGPPLSTALQDQLGLKIEPRRVSVPVLVIDRIEPLTSD